MSRIRRSLNLRVKNGPRYRQVEWPASEFSCTTAMPITPTGKFYRLHYGASTRPIPREFRSGISCNCLLLLRGKEATSARVAARHHPPTGKAARVLEFVIAIAVCPSFFSTFSRRGKTPNPAWRGGPYLSFPLDNVGGCRRDANPANSDGAALEMGKWGSRGTGNSIRRSVISFICGRC